MFNDLAIETKEEAHRVSNEVTRAMNILKRIDYNDEWRDIKSDIDEAMEILEDINNDIY